MRITYVQFFVLGIYFEKLSGYTDNSNDYRTNGLGNFKYAMGNFRNDVYGNYIRYTHSSCHSYVVMSVDGKILVINGENDSATEEIYHTISEKMSRELE